MPGQRAGDAGDADDARRAPAERFNNCGMLGQTQTPVPQALELETSLIRLAAVLYIHRNSPSINHHLPCICMQKKGRRAEAF